MKKKLNDETKIAQPHDRFFKQLMTNIPLAREFLNLHMSPDIRKHLDLSYLKVKRGNYVDDLRKESIADMVFETQCMGKEAFIQLIVDHQSEPDKFMPVRILRYICNFIDEHLKKTRAEQIPLIIPMVVYHGLEPWKYSTNINDLVDAPRELTDNHFLKPFQLIDLNTIPDDVLTQSVYSGVLTMSLKYICWRNLLDHLDKISPLMKQLGHTRRAKRIIENVLIYYIDRGDINDMDSYFDWVKKEFSEKVGEKVMTISEQLRAEGKVEGKAEGKVEGKLEVLECLLKKNVSEEFIEEVTGFSLAKIKKIRDELLVN